MNILCRESFSVSWCVWNCSDTATSLGIYSDCSAIIVLFLCYYWTRAVLIIQPSQLLQVISMKYYFPPVFCFHLRGTAIEPFYFHHAEPHAVLHGFYFMNNFHSLPEAGITLFELTVVNNWSIIMEVQWENFARPFLQNLFPGLCHCHRD